MKNLLFTLIILCWTSYASYSQTDYSKPNRKTVKAQIGFTHFNLLDKRVSAIAISGWAPSSALSFKKVSEKIKTEFKMSYGKNSNLGSPQVIKFNTHHFNFEYSFEAKINDQWIGGFIEFPTFLLFPNHHLYNNNPISYTMMMSLGPKWSKTFELTDQLRTSVSGRAALASYVIRPAYGHPYPERFLDPENFDPTRAGMAKSTITSGKLLPFTKMQSINIQLGVYYRINNRIDLSMDYSTRIFRDNTPKGINYRTNEIHLGIEFTY